LGLGGHRAGRQRGLYLRRIEKIDFTLAYDYPRIGIAELMPNAQRETIKGQTHQAAPEAVAPMLIAFFGEGK
jgi:hypothetical protein